MRKNKGFTLIELMIVIAIIAIIAAIAIPNLMQSRIRANETATISQLRNYVQAQSLFHGRGFGKLAVNTTAANLETSAYADNFQNLYYGHVVEGDATGLAVASATQNARLISKAHADAISSVGVSGAATVTAIETPPPAPVVFNGYWYLEPIEASGTPATFFLDRFAQVSAPTDSDRTGTRLFFIDDGGNVLNRLLAPATPEATAIVMPTPLTVGTANWNVN